MKAIWQNIEKELKKLSPEMLQGLNPGAADADFQLLEKVIGAKLPVDFIEFYRVHNGQEDAIGGLMEGEQLLPIDAMISEWNIWKELFDSNTFCESDGTPYDSDADPGIKPMWWNPLWIPITYDGAGNHYCLDLDPDQGGKYGQIIRMWHDDAERTLEADSFLEFMKNFEQDLQAGVFEFEEYLGIVRKE